MRIQKIQIIIGLLLLLILVVIIVFQFYSKPNDTNKSELITQVDSLISWKNNKYTDSIEVALIIIEKAKTLAINSEDKKTLGDVYAKEGSFYKSINGYPRAILSYRNAIEYYENSNDIYSHSKSYYNIADIYKMLGDYNKSLDACNTGISIAKQLDNEVKLRKFYRTMGSVYKYTGNFEKSLEYYFLALEISKRDGSERNIAVALNNLGTAYEAMGQDSVALEYFNQTFDANFKRKNIDGLSIFHNNVASIYIRINQADDAIFNLRKALQYRLLSPDKRNEATILYNMGDYFRKVNQLDSAIFYLDWSLKLATMYGFKERVYEAGSLLSKAYLDNEMPKKAYYELLKVENAKDAIFSEQKSLEIAKLETSFSEQEERTARTNKLQIKNLFYIIYILSLAVFVFVLFSVYRLYQKSIKTHREQITQISDEKSEIEKSLLEKKEELIKYSLQIAQKNEFETALVKNINSKYKGLNAETKEHLQNIVNEIKIESTSQMVWKEFELRFNQVNSSFIKNLKEQFPDLTSNENRLCALLSLDLNTKEISQITGQSAHSINVARTRLRKKLGLLNSKISFSQFLSSIPTN